MAAEADAGVDVDLEFVAVGVNRVVNALAWSQHGGVAYAAHHVVILYDVEVGPGRPAARMTAPPVAPGGARCACNRRQALRWWCWY